METPELGTVISFSHAALHKDCSHMTLRNAAKNGVLNGTTIMGRQGLIVNQAYLDWKVKEWGKRLSKKYGRRKLVQ